MTKTFKTIIQIIVLLILVLGLFFYFTHQTTEKPSVVPALKTFTFEPAEDLDPTIREKYFQRFTQAKEILAQEPNNLEAWLELGSIMKGIKNYQQAEAVWLEMSQQWPNQAIIFGNLGDLYTNFLKDYPQAEWAFQKAIETSSGLAEQLIYYRNLHELYKYAYQEKADLADDILLEGLEKYPDEPDLLALLAVYYRDIGDKTKAIEYFEKLLAVDPTNEAAQRDLEALRRGQPSNSSPH